MSDADELAVIEGITPNVLLKDGEEREVGSTTSKSMYKVKRTFDHYYCSCPAWRNQSGVPVNARTCKHLKSFLGDAYEVARLKMKNPEGPPPKGATAAKKPAAKAKPASKAKAPAKRKKVEDDDKADDDDDDDGDEDKPPVKRARRTPSKPTSKANGKGTNTEGEDEEEKPAVKRTRKPVSKATAKGKAVASVKEEDEDEKNSTAKTTRKPSSRATGKIKTANNLKQEDGENNVKATATKNSDEDELANINGIAPKIMLEDGKETEVNSATSKAVYKIKRTFDHYFCSCPAWRNQKGVPVNARTCKHLQSLLGDEYEAARLKLKNPDGPPPKGVGKKPASKAKVPAKVKGRVKVEEDIEEEDEDEIDEEEDKPAAKKKAESVSSNGIAKGKATKVEGDDGEDEDDLANIDGVTPKVILMDGEEREVGSASSKAVYKIKRTFDHYYCSCPAWRNQSGVSVNARSCKHLKALLGDVYETARLKLKNSADPSPKGGTTKKPASKTIARSKAKARTKVEKDEDEDDEDEDDGDENEDGDEDEDEDEKSDLAPVSKGESTKSGPTDELAEIDGIKPKVFLQDGEDKEVRSMTSNSAYKVKRTWDHYYCSCPAWRNQAGCPVNARTCKHLMSLLGDAYEIARLKLKNPEGPLPKGAAPKKGAAKRKKADDDDDDKPAAKRAKEDDDPEEDDIPVGKNVPELLLANKWDMENSLDPTGWWMSEKLDGVRTYYDGKQMISRLGNPFTPPQWFLEKLPKDITLDGELFGGRGEFQSTVSIVKTVNSPHWQNITFQIFDIPSRGHETFEERIAFLKRTFGEGGTHASKQVVVVEHEIAKSRQHVLEKLKEVETLGGEGLMLRKPASQYEGRRSATLLKIKTFYDAEAIVTGYMPGKGRNKGTTGALKCKMESGKTFNVGTGLSDKIRKNPPKVGSIIVYRFQELTRDGVPRFPSYIGEAVDKLVPKDAEIPEHRKAGVNFKPTEA